MTHPNAIDLEAFACGEPAPKITSHIEGCDACRSYVERAQGLAAPKGNVTPLFANARRVERSRRVTLVATVGAPLAIAAAILLYTGTREAPHPAASNAPPSAASTALAIAEPPSTEPETTFKGGVQLAVIRERKGEQERFIGPIRVHPGDRLRIEVALDRSRAILGAVLGDDGSWLELMPEAVRDSGTYFSEKSTRIDNQPLSGTIVVGTPEDVRRVHQTHKLDGVATLRVEWEAK